MRIDVIDEDKMKSPSGKEQWRAFIAQFEHRVADFNFATLLRKDVRGEYTEENTILGE